MLRVFVAWCEKHESARATDKGMGLLYLIFEGIQRAVHDSDELMGTLRLVHPTKGRAWENPAE